ncbi:MAG: hypothetical protein K5986_06115 [Clostridium sp.]|uniref:hypothetical protein n=1 Tax=Clostridium sp. DSM 8431 TaxID=1761781 RepID=UPI0008E77C00|nr:hypothetical protein [Clostridium sp. DSM 8431]MCR4944020.1 hypothetical protein [Clostridium sp.]SFU60168.1 hypothetical protein SAMN04487886_10715 [Clostridium sp. DSM 8431]
MKITIRVYDSKIAILVLFVLLSENGMYLIDISKFNIAGALNYNDLWAYTLALYEIYYIAKMKMKGKYTFLFEMLGIVASCIIASFQGAYNMGQSVGMGIRPQRFFIIGMMLYFLVRKELANRKMTAFNLLDMLITMGIFEGFLCTMQYFLSGKIEFLHASSNMRYGSIRLYFDSGLMMFTAIAGWCAYLRKGGKRYLVAVGFGLIYEFLISKGRLENLCVLCALFVAFFLLRKNAFKKSMVTISLVIAVVFLMNTSYSKVLINAVKSSMGSQVEDDSGDSEDTMSIRKEGREHYANQSSKSLSNTILGCGYPNTLSERSCEYARTDTYALVDNGIYAYKFIYGWVGVGVVVLVALRAIFESLVIYVKKGGLFPISYIVFLVPIAYNIIFWWWKPDSTLLLSIYLAIVDHYYSDKLAEDEFVI